MSFQGRSLLLLAEESSGTVLIHEAVPRLQFVMGQLVSGGSRLSCAFHAAGNSPPDVKIEGRYRPV